MLSITTSFLIKLNVCLFAFILLFFLYVIIQKMILKEKRMQHLKHKDQLRPVIFEYLSQNEAPFSRHLRSSHIPYELLDELLEEYSQLLKGEEIHNRIKQFATNHMLDYYSTKLTSGRWCTRMNALYKIEDLQLYQLVDQIWDVYQQKSLHDEERYQVVRTLAALQSKQLLDVLLQRDSNYPLFLYKEILRRWNEETFMRFIEQVSQPPADFEKAIIEIIGERKELQLVRYVEERLLREELEIRISSLKAIYAIGSTKSAEIILPFASSTYWQERMLFAKISGKLLKNRYKPLLTSLIADENWFVRNAAGESLFYYQDGLTILHYIVEQHTDSFAKDIARQWIERGAAG